MACLRCRLSWDVDDEPPPCPLTAGPVPDRTDERPGPPNTEKSREWCKECGFGHEVLVLRHKSWCSKAKKDI